MVDQNDAETKAQLIAAARELIAQNAEFPLKELLVRTGISKAQFRRCFADKAQLLAALAGEDVKGLSEILQAAQPVRVAPVHLAPAHMASVQLASGSDVMPVLPSAFAPPSAAPAVNDAWLERRLRVFERALASLEKRQEKSEEIMAQQLALIREALSGMNQTGMNQTGRIQTSLVEENQAAAPSSAAAVAMEPVEPEPAPQSFEPFLEQSEAANIPSPEPSGISSMVDVVSEENDESARGVLGELEPFSLEPGALASVPSAEVLSEETAEETAFAAEIASIEEPVSDEGEEPMTQAVSGTMAEREPQKEVVDFIAHARRAAHQAAQAEHNKPKSSLNMRWLGWGAAALMVLLICAGMVLAAGAINGGARGMLPAATARPLPQVAANGGMNSGINSGINSGTARRQPADKGIAHLIALADSGDARAETALALAYLRGEGVAGDEEAARRWSQAAAAQGQPVAEYVLGTLYLEGNRNESEAARWFLAAAAQGNIKAMHNLAIAYAEGQGVEKDPAEAVKWFLRAAEAGYRDSQFDLGVVYERGLGVPQSARAALKWYLIAAAHGDMPSASRAQTLKEQMDPSEVKQASVDAASFAPQEASLSANQAPVL